MDTRKVWPETIISGFFYFTGVIVIIMRLFGLCEEQILRLLKNMPDMNTGILTMLSAGIIGGSYLFGHLAGGLMAGFFDCVGEYLEKIKSEPVQSKLKKFFFFFIYIFKRMFNKVVDSKDQDEAEKLVKIISRNEERLTVELQGRYAAKYFYRSMLGGIPILSFPILSFAIIPFDYSINRLWAILIFVIAGVLELLFIIAFFRERKKHTSLFQEMEKLSG